MLKFTKHGIQIKEVKTEKYERGEYIPYWIVAISAIPAIVFVVMFFLRR